MRPIRQLTVLWLALTLTSIGCGHDARGIEKTLRDYLAAVKSGNRAELKRLLTPDLYEQHAHMQSAVGLAKTGLGLTKSLDEELGQIQAIAKEEDAEVLGDLATQARDFINGPAITLAGNLGPPAKLELVSVKVDRIEGDTAWVDAEILYRRKGSSTDRKQGLRAVLKKNGAAWKIAGFDATAK